MKRIVLMGMTCTTLWVLLCSTLTLNAEERTAESTAPAKSQAVKSAPVQTPDGATALPPRMMGERKSAGPAGGSTTATHSAFSQEEILEFHRKVKEHSDKTMELNKKIAERHAAIMESNPAIKDLLARLQEMQKQINAIVDADAELAKLKTRYDILWTIQPDQPKGSGTPFNPNMGMPKGPGGPFNPNMMSRQGPGAAFNPKPAFGGTNMPMLMPFGPAKASTN